MQRRVGADALDRPASTEPRATDQPVGEVSAKADPIRRPARLRIRAVAVLAAGRQDDEGTNGRRKRAVLELDRPFARFDQD